MPICVTGMHRSGTSMVTRLLRTCGLYLGLGSEMMTPAPDNADGFWENIVFVNLNDQLLRHLGGAWNAPPVVADGWEYRPEVQRFLEQAEELARHFAPNEPWGWKDPRTALVLPLWQRVLPTLKVLVCVRNPLEVNRSLEKRRNVFPPNLWLAYNRRLLAATTPEQRVVTHYDSYYFDPAAELDRVTRLLGLDVNREKISSAVSGIRKELRHNQSSTQELLEADVGAHVVKCYMDLCAEAGPVYETALGTQPVLLRGVPHPEFRVISPTQSTRLGYQDAGRILRLAARLSAFDEKLSLIQDLQNQLASRDQALRDLQARGEEAEKVWIGRLSVVNSEMTAKEGVIRALQTQCQNLQARCQDMEASRRQVLELQARAGAKDLENRQLLARCTLQEREQQALRETAVKFQDQLVEQQNVNLALRAESARQQVLLRGLAEEIEQIKGSKAWKVACFLRRVRQSTLPDGTAHVLAVQRLLRSVRRVRATAR